MVRTATWLSMFTVLVFHSGCASTSAPGNAFPADGPRRPATSDILEAYGRLPLHFEENAGQVDPSVRFIARTEGGAVWLTNEGVVIGVDGRVIRLGLGGGETTPRLAALDTLPGRVNYYRGQNPRDWLTDIPTHGRVRYEAVYPGIDVVVYGNHRRLEYDFVIAAGADPGLIRLTITGAETLELDAAGDLMIRGGARTVVQRAPVIYQERNGRRETVRGGYVIRGPTEVAFAVGPYDRSRPLVIDPVIAYSTRIGGGIGRGIAVDAAGYAYVIGSVDSSWPLVNNAFSPKHCCFGDIGLTKLTPNGDALVFSTVIGSFGPDNATGIALDSSGNAWITGYAGGGGVGGQCDYPTTPDAVMTTCGTGGSDGTAGVVSKFSSTGSLLYSTYLGGTSTGVESLPSGACKQTRANSVAVDASNNAYVVGYTQVLDFPTTPGAFQGSRAAGPSADYCHGDSAGFAMKFNANGSLAYSTYLDGAAGRDEALGVAVDAVGNAYVVGHSDHPPFTIIASVATGGGTTGGYLLKLDATGLPARATALGADFDFVALGADGSAYVSGSVFSAGAFSPVNAFQPSFAGVVDGVAGRLNPAGTAWIWSTFIGGPGSDYINGIVPDTDGSAWLVGTTASANADFPTKYASQAKVGTQDAVALKLSATGTLVFSTYLGEGQGEAITMDSAGNVYFAGVADLGFPTTPGAYKTTAAPGGEVFAMKYFADHTPPTVTIASPGDGAWTGNSIYVNAQANDSGGFGELQVWGNGAIFQKTVCSGNTVCATGDWWNTGVLATGAYEINAVAIDAWGHCTISSKVTINKDARTPVTPSGAVCPAGGGTPPPPPPPSLTASILNPTNGSSVSGVVTVSMGAGNAQGSPTQFLLKQDNATTLSSQSVAGSTATYNWDTSAVPRGAHTLNLTVTDAANRTATASVSVTVTDPPSGGSDSTPPSVSITKPANNAWTGNSIQVGATATDNVGLANIKLWGNGAIFGTIACSGTTCSGTIEWATGSLATGAYQVQAVATDTAGNCAVSSPITINKDATSPVKPSGAPACGGGGATDTTPPSVSMTAPGNGATVSGSVTVSATASDNVGVAGVQFKLDGATLGSEDTTAPYAITWDTTTTANGTHTLTATARDAAGNTATSTAVTVTVNNPPPSGGDTTKPTVAITSPGNNAWTGNSIHVVATASDNVAVASIKIYGNGGVVLQKACGGTSCTLDDWWTTGSLATGAYQIQAVATDTAGNCAVSPPVTINKDATSPVKPSGAPAC
jgi:hypothetical protein